ncbi:MAG: MBL fold metallo-hydrolase [Erysipelotrichaceae bacterium]|nr:MBL fold metallo-hydrolase [Erysipelotrichaceae bacterium]
MLNSWRSKITSVFKQDYFFSSFLLVIYALVHENFPFSAAILLLIVYGCKHRLSIVMIIMMLLINLPLANLSTPNSYQGKIIDVKANYYIVKLCDQKILLYTEQKLNYDQRISFTGKYELIKGESTNYGFDFAAFNDRQHIHYQIKAADIKVINQAFSLRSYLLARVDQPYIHKFIFNINSDDDLISNFVSCGYSFGGFIYLILQLLSIKLKPHTLKKIEGLMLGFFAVFYHFNYVASRMLLAYALRRTSCNSKQKASVLAYFTLIFFPWNIFSLKFLLPYGINIIYALKYDKRWIIIYNILLQSYLFAKVNIILLFGYKYLIKILGLCFCISVLGLFMDVSYIMTLINQFMAYLELFVIYQSSKSYFFALFFILVYQCFKQKLTLIIISLLVFLATGSSFPYACVSYINVGQGDAILIQDHFKQATYLIDTGKPSSYRKLDTFLQAKGIKKIDILFISHYDSDHCGNLNRLLQDYQILRVVDYHFTKLIDKLTFYDLNDHYPEKNENSLVLYTMINGQGLLFTGDAHVKNELAIIEKYPLLSCDYLKLGHHGSKTSSAQGFLHTLRPKLALISSGNFSYYQHPHPTIINLLRNMHIPYLVTNNEGDIEIYFTFLGEIITTSSRKISFVFNPNLLNHDIIRTR